MEAQIRELALTILRDLPNLDLRNGFTGEEEWCGELADRLKNYLPITATASRGKSNYYPGTRQSIDLMIRFQNETCLWLECKGAWKSCFGDTGKANPSFRKHLLRDDPKEHSALSDIRYKLTQITTASDYVGELLVGFDSVLRPMDKDVDELIETAGLNRHPWEGYHLRWVNPNDHKYSFGCWLWIRPVGTPVVIS